MPFNPTDNLLETYQFHGGGGTVVEEIGKLIAVFHCENSDHDPRFHWEPDQAFIWRRWSWFDQIGAMTVKNGGSSRFRSGASRLWSVTEFDSIRSGSTRSRWQAPSWCAMSRGFDNSLLEFTFVYDDSRWWRLCLHGYGEPQLWRCESWQLGEIVNISTWFLFDWTVLEMYFWMAFSISLPSESRDANIQPVGFASGFWSSGTCNANGLRVDAFTLFL